jgi:predicted flap endonuclease-1-like 5' DNA nuclease
MEYLAVQMSVFWGGAIVGGVLLGWWFTQFFYRQAANACHVELLGLRRNYEDSTKENSQLRYKLQQLDGMLRKISTLPSDAEYGQFLQVRKKLEKTRLQYQSLLNKCHHQQKMLARLTNELQDSKQELMSLQVAFSQQHSSLVTKPPVVSVPLQEKNTLADKRDDLTLIQGINQHIASKLQALGIVTYRQIAECTEDDIHSIQRTLGLELMPPPEGWVQHAYSLFQQKYPPLLA